MESRSLTSRVGRLDVAYDEDRDVLYIAIDKQRAADTFDTEHGLLVRKDPESKEIVGVTILHYGGFFKKLLDYSWLKDLQLPKELESYLLNPSV